EWSARRWATQDEVGGVDSMPPSATANGVDVCPRRGKVAAASTRRASLDDEISVKDWLGRTQRDEDEIALGAVQRLAATLDQDPGAFKRGSALPESWDAVLFGTLARQTDPRPHRHPPTRGLIPPMHRPPRQLAEP